MSQMKWTPAQESALSARGGSLLLSAAAGSGKTAVLVARIIRRITDPADPTDVNAFLVLTFTRSAAAEMRSRIGEALSQELSGAARALETAPTEENRRRAAYLQRQLTLLGSASISTIDAFCQSVLRQYFYLLDMDPDFRILSDENEKYLLQDEVLSEVFLSWYEKDDPRFRDCVDLFSSGYQDTNLRETVRRIYEFSRSLAFPEEFLRRLALPYGVQAAETPDDLPWTAELLASFRDAAASWESKYREILRAVEADELFFAPYKEAVSDEYAAISYLASGRCRTWGEWHSAVQAVTFRRLKPLPKKESTEARLRRKEDIARLRDAVKKGVKDLADTYFSIPPAQWLSDLAAAAPIAQVLSEVLLDFSRAYEARKKKEGLLEFNDMEHLVLRLLLAEGSAPDRLIPSETALALRKKYREVMVDEYQDTNDLQEIITALISDGKNRFLVGDIKQSIYRFRQADPGIFLRKYETFRDGENGRRIDLNQNFRSDPAVLTAANFIFRQLLRRDGGRAPLELDYGDAEALHPGRRSDGAPDSFIAGAVDIDLLDLSGKEEAEEESENDLDKTELEAQMIAGKIRRFFREGKQVMEKDGSFRPLRYGDIVILLRAVDKKAPVIIKTLRAEGIPAVCGQTDDLFSAMEIQILWALLKILDNPRQDLALAAVLRSPLCGLSDESLARLRLRGRDSLWEALPQATDILSGGEALRCRRFLDRYRKWRALSRQIGAAPLLEAILADTDFLAYLSGMQEGAFRRARVLSLCETARVWDGQFIGGLYHFLRYLQKTADSQSRLRQRTAPPIDASAVRIMTIHKSKGLEFPVVFLAGCGSRFNQKELIQPAILHKEKGLGLHRFDRDSLCRWPTLYWYAVRQDIRRESLAEEARLLYVAMTRARDKLIITGAVKDAASALSGWFQGLTGSENIIPPLPAYRITGASCYFDWIMPAVAGSRSMENAWTLADAVPAYVSEKDGAPRFAFALHTVAEYAAPAAESETDGAQPVSHFLAAPAGPAPDWVEERFAWRYGHPGAADTPAKLTATAAVQLAEAEKEEYMPSRVVAGDIPEKAPLPPDFAAAPAFLADSGAPLRGAAYGTLMHKAMEKLDLARMNTDDAAIRAEIERLAAENAFTAEEARVLLGSGPLGDIRAFLTGPLGSLVRSADILRREMAFSILLPAWKFYPHCEKDEQIFLQGAIDCLAEKDGTLTIIDYKTDRVPEGSLLRDHYQRQLRIYGAAAERIFKKPVAGLWLWSFHLREAVPVPFRES